MWPSMSGVSAKMPETRSRCSSLHCAAAVSGTATSKTGMIVSCFVAVNDVGSRLIGQAVIRSNCGPRRRVGSLASMVCMGERKIAVVVGDPTAVRPAS